jgi:hypothetical protein
MGPLRDKNVENVQPDSEVNSKRTPETNKVLEKKADTPHYNNINAKVITL